MRDPAEIALDEEVQKARDLANEVRYQLEGKSIRIHQLEKVEADLRTILYVQARILGELGHRPIREFKYAPTPGWTRNKIVPATNNGFYLVED